jgi:hypothetical protein
MLYKSISIAFISILVICFENCHNRNISPIIHLDNLQNKQTFFVTIGDTFDFKLQNVGPGIYGNPILSDSGLIYLGQSEVEPAIPAGVGQIYKFFARAVGSTNITVIQSGNMVNDTFSVVCKIQN